LNVRLPWPERALDLLAKSIKLKKSIGDDAGVASALEVQAVAFATLGDLESALESYDRSYTLAREIGHVYLTCLVELNRAHTLYDFGKRSKALRHVSSGCRIASTEGYDELERRCLELKGTICFDMRKLADSIDCFENLLEKATTSEDFTRALCARHALGVAYRMTGTDEQSGTHFSAGITLAKKLGEDEWAARCLADRTRALVDGELRAADTQQLRKQAKNQENRGATRLAGLIWRTIAYSLMESDAQIEEVRTALERAAQLLFDADDPEQEWGGVVEDLHSFLWDNKFFRDAIVVLQVWTQRAKSRQLFEAECAWLDQRAVCLTQLEDFAEAERLHRRAATLAQRHALGEQLQRSKHNLGECLLRHGHAEKAVDVLQEAREVAKSLDDIESELTTAHSYALAQRDLGNEKVASSTLTECRDRAERLGYWREYVRAWLALANLAWSTGRPKLSERRYRRALKEAKRHRCEEMVADISVNLASLLRSNGKVRQALKLLETGVEAAKDQLNGSVYCIELAETYEAANEPQKAITAWEYGRTASLVAEDMEGYAICSSRLAELRLRTGQLGDAEEELRSLLSERQLPTEDRVIALGQLLRVLMNSDEQRNAQSEYSEFTSLSRCQEFYEHYIDIHMAFFDHGWKAEDGDRLQGLQAYVQALIAEIEFADENKFGPVVGHVLSTILFEHRAFSHDQLRTLRREFQVWLQTQTDDNFYVKLLMMPLAIADDLYPGRGDALATANRIEELAESYRIKDIELDDSGDC